MMKSALVRVTAQATALLAPLLFLGTVASAQPSNSVPAGLGLTSSLGEILGRDKRLFPGEIYWNGLGGSVKVAVADLDKDGAVDLIAGGNSQTALHLNNGRGDFSRVQLLDIPVQSQMLLADLNRDGNADLLSLDGQGRVHIYLGTTNHSFSASSAIQSSSLRSIITADLNNDGSPDLVGINSAGLAFFAGKGDGLFAPLGTLAIGNVQALAIADVTGDGKVDLIWAPAIEASVKVARGSGDGTFAEPMALPVRGTVRVLLSADVDNDGRGDIVAGLLESPQLVLWAGLGDGGFKEPQQIDLGGSGMVTKLDYLDLDGDGRKEVVAQSVPGSPPNYLRIQTVKLSSSGDPQLRSVFEWEAISPAEWADVNGDGWIDAIFPTTSGVLVFLATPGGILGRASRLETQWPTMNTPAAREHLASGDIDGDGFGDFADQHGNAFFGSPGGTLTAVTMPDSSSTFMLGTDVALADLNRDGRLDLVISLGQSAGLTGNVVRVFLQDTNRTFRRLEDFPVAASPTFMKVADFNGDQIPDVVTMSRPGADSTLTFLFGRGDGGLQNRQDLPLPKVTGRTLVPQDLFVADVTGDGLADVLVVSLALSYYTSYLTVFESTRSSPALAAHSPVLLGSKRFGSVCAMGDFNRDNRPDLVLLQQSGASQELGVFLGDGAGGFQQGPIRSLSRAPRFLHANDVDRDGNLDLVALEPESITIYFGSATGQFPVMRSFFAGYDPSFVTTADLNGDGWPELLVSRAQHMSVDPNKGLSPDVMMVRLARQSLNPGAEATRLRQVFAPYEEEIYQIVAFDWAEELRRRLRALLAKLLPALLAYANKQPPNFAMTSDMVTESNALLDELANRASPGLKAVLASERARVNQLQDFVDQDFAQVLSRYYQEELRILAAALRAEGFRLLINGAVDGKYSLLRALSLLPASWSKVPATTGQVENSKPILIDPNPPRGSAFYRVLKE